MQLLRYRLFLGVGLFPIVFCISLVSSPQKAEAIVPHPAGTIARDVYRNNKENGNGTLKNLLDRINPVKPRHTEEQIVAVEQSISRIKQEIAKREGKNKQKKKVNQLKLQLATLEQRLDQLRNATGTNLAVPTQSTSSWKVSGTIYNAKKDKVANATVYCLVKSSDSASWEKKAEVKSDSNGAYSCDVETNQKSIFIVAQSGNEWCDVEVKITSESAPILQGNDVAMDPESSGKSKINVKTAETNKEVVLTREYPVYGNKLTVTQPANKVFENLASGYWKAELKENTASKGIALLTGDNEATISLTKSASCDKTKIKTGVNVSLHSCLFFTPNDPWNVDVSKAPTDPRSKDIIEHLGAIALDVEYENSYTVTDDKASIMRVEVGGNSDPPEMFRIPQGVKISEQGGPGGPDGHVSVLNLDRWELYEAWKSKIEGGVFKGTHLSYFNLSNDEWTRRNQRPHLKGKGIISSANSAGMPILPGLLRYDEACEQGEINHALTFAMPEKYISPTVVYPATKPKTDGKARGNGLPNGGRLRLRADVEIKDSLHPCTKAVLRALKKHGMFLVDGTGHNQNMKIAASPSQGMTRGWTDNLSKIVRDELHGEEIHEGYKAHMFEVVEMGRIFQSEDESSTQIVDEPFNNLNFAQPVKWINSTPDEGQPFADNGPWFQVNHKNFNPPSAYRISAPFSNDGNLAIESYSLQQKDPSQLFSIVGDPANPGNKVLKINSSDHTDATIVTVTKPLGNRYEVCGRVGYVNFGNGKEQVVNGRVNGYNGDESSGVWGRGDGKSVHENGFYFGSLYSTYPQPHNNVYAHHNRIAFMDTDNNFGDWSQIWNGKRFIKDGEHPVLMIALSRNSQVDNYTGPRWFAFANGKFQTQGMLASVDAYKDNTWYKVCYKRMDNKLTMSISGDFKYGGRKTYSGTIDGNLLYHFDKQHFFYMGDPHINYYEGTALIDDISVKVFN